MKLIDKIGRDKTFGDILIGWGIDYLIQRVKVEQKHQETSGLEMIVHFLKVIGGKREN